MPVIKRLLQILFRPWSRGLPRNQSAWRRGHKQKRPRDRTHPSVPREDLIKTLNKTYQQPAVIPDWAIKASAPSLFSRSLLFGNSKFGRKLKIQLAKAHKAKQQSLNRKPLGRSPSAQLSFQLDSKYIGANDANTNDANTNDVNTNDANTNDANNSYSDHPDLIKSLTDAAYVCHCQGRYSEAERLYQDVLKLSIQRFGDNHAELIAPLGDLANFFCGRRRYFEAEPLLQQLIELRSHHQSAYHPDVADVIAQLASTYRYQHRHIEADQCYQRALTILSQALGEDHSRTQALNALRAQVLAESPLIEHLKLIDTAPTPLNLDRLSEQHSWARPNWLAPMCDDTFSWVLHGWGKRAK